jgi:tetratricopeptide (TPR) repeat protein
MIKVGESKKSEDVEDDYACPACGIPRLAWQNECSECGHKFDSDIKIKSDSEIEEAKRKDKMAKKLEKKKKGYWRNLDPKEYSRIRNGMYAAEFVLLILLVINTTYTNMDLDPVYIPIGPPLFIVMVFAIIFAIEGLWFKYLDILRAGKYEKRLKYIKEFRLRSQSVFVVTIILIIIFMSLGTLTLFSDMLTTEKEVNLPIDQTEKFEFYSQDPLGLTQVTNINVSMNRSVDIYLLTNQEDEDVTPDIYNSIMYHQGRDSLEYDLEAPEYELDFPDRDGYIIYGYNNNGNANAEGDYTVEREFSKPLLFMLILFSLFFIIISICWIAFLNYTQNFYDKLNKQKIEELTAKYKIDPYTIEDVFLVYSDGTLINHQTRRLKTMDDDIFMGMLTSIKDFIKDAMSQDVKGELNELTYGKLKILIEHGAYVFLAVVVSGKPPPELRNLMKSAVRRIHKNHLAELRNWDGNIGKMEPAKKIITEMIKQGSKGGGRPTKFDKKSSNAWNDRGVVYTKIGNYQEAMKCFDWSIRINPSVSEVWSNKGILLYKMHKYERAMKCFDRALTLNPLNKKAKNRREKCWYKMQLRDAKRGKRTMDLTAAPSPQIGISRPPQRRVATATPRSGVQSQGYGMEAGNTGSGFRTQTAGSIQPAGRTRAVYKTGTEPCPDCGQPMRYTHEYKDWWCDNCNRYPYEDDDDPYQTDSNYLCETCGQPLEYIDEYQKWYCDYCQKYA